MSIAKKRILLSIIATIMLVITISGVAYAFISAHYVNQWHALTWNAIQAGFYADHPTDGTYETRWNSHIRKCYVKLIEKKSNGSITKNTGEQWSTTASSISDSRHHRTPYTKMYDSIWPIWEDYTTYSSWSWRYF